MCITNLFHPTLTIKNKNGVINVFYLGEDKDSYLICDNKRIDLSSHSQKLSFQNNAVGLFLGNQPKYTLNIESENGYIRVESFVGHGLNLKTNDGNITVYRSIEKELSTISNNGNIIVHSSMANHLDLVNYNGHTSFSEIAATKGIITSNNGKINIQDAAFAEKLSIRSRNGCLNGSNIAAREFSIYSEADIALKNVATNNFLANTTSDVTLSLNGKKEDYNYSIFSLAEEIKETKEKWFTESSTPKKKLFIKSTEGDVHVHYLGSK